MTDDHGLTTEGAGALSGAAPMHPLVEKMLEKDPTPETLEKIMVLQREHEKDMARKAYTRAMVALKADLPSVIAHDQKVDFTSSKGRTFYTHTSLAAAMDAVTPHLQKHGFSLSWSGDTKDGKVYVTVTLTHRDGHSESMTYDAAPDTSGNKSHVQAIASTTTLLQRYSALMMLGIATADMKEPGPPPPPPADSIDTKKNMKAMDALKKMGKAKKKVEKYVGKPIEKWTEADLQKLREWVKSEPKETAGDPPRERKKDPSPESPLADDPVLTGKQLADARKVELGLSDEELQTLARNEYGNEPLDDRKANDFLLLLAQVKAGKSVTVVDGRFVKPGSGGGLFES